MKRTRLLFFALVSIFILVTVLVPHKNLAESNSSDQVRRELDGALYMETELFGTKARMPLPTEESKTRLGLLIEKYPTNRTVRQRLSIVYEELQDFEAAEKQMIAIRDNENSSIESLRLLGEFYHRRANFKKEAEILKQLMEIVPTYEKGVIFYELITLSEQHQLDNFLDESSYEKLVKEDQDGFEILKKLVERLQTKGSYNRAIKLLDSFQSLFPQEKEYFVTKKVALYLAQKDFQNAEAVYLKAFDLFWSDAMSINFYQFLRDVNRYREYKRNLVEALKKDPANFDTAMRLFHFQLKGESREKRALAVLQQLEMARTQTAGQTEWTAEELSVVAQLFVAAGELDKASRYFYTLYVRGGLEKSSTQREMMLYRLFKTLLSAKYERSVLATGDLRFYKDIATSDQNPGILGGILSLVLANSGPSDEYEKADRIADLYFNRAAAYKIFTAYKQEFPESTVLPQMYADMMRLYIDMEKKDLVNVLAKEFEQKYLGKSQYADAFAQVAEIYIQLKKPEKAVHIYQTLLDTLAKNRKEGQLLVKRSNLDSWEASSRLVNRRLSYLSSSQIFEASYEAQKRETEEGGEAGGDTSTDNTTQYQEYEYISYLTYGDKPTLFSADSLKPIVINKKLQYEEVLNSYISLLQSRRENEKIVALYWQEIQKYPTEEGLYERFLQWLSSTNLISDELKAYQLAIEKVPNNKSWQARLARWYLRQQRSEELTEISNRLVEIFDEDELQDYLEKVLDQTADKVSFYDQVLRLTLYKNALRRFPENIVFVNGLLNYYRLEKRYKDYLELAMQYYFAGMRDVALQQLASTGELRAYYKEALSKVTKDDSLPSLAYQQFSADAAIQLSHYEAAVESYRKLARLYPGNENYANRLVMLLRSFGQVAESNLKEAITIRQRLTNIYPTSEIYLTELGELYAELGDFENARKQWDAITGQAKGSPENYLSAASVFWDYYQYDDALRVINTLRKVEQNPNLYAFQAGAIYENKRDLQSAISEYTKDLVDYEAKQQSVYRLKRLADKPVLRQFIEKTVEERLASSKNNYSLVIGYARLLDRIGDIDAASEVFNRYIAKSGDIDFIHTARSFFAKKHRVADEIRALERLTEVATEGLPMMAYKLQLASVYEQKGDVAKAVLIYDNLVQSFPTSYGLIKTATKFYWRIGEKERTFSLLRNASLRGKGSFYFEFGLELADYQVLADNLQEAEATLVVLYEKNPFSNELFEKLTRVVAKQKKRDRLLELYKIAYKYAEEINDKDRYGYSAAFAALYTTMANSFEEVGDHVSALEQYCLKVNNGSDDGGNNLESAYDYARRYKLLDRLIGYYKEVSEQSSRNYRWNVALARIYELQDRWADAAREYEKAIRNEPQILTLYEAISDVYLQMRQSKEAIGWLTRAYQLSGSADRYKKLIAAVEIFKFDRAIARTYLRSMNTDDSKSQTYSSYKHLFAENFGTNIYKQGIYSFYITAYAEELVREGKTLTQIFGELWMLREKVKVEVEKPNNPGHQQAELVYQSFNSAIPEAVVSVIANKVTIEDRLAFGTKLKELVTGRDQTKDTLLLQIASLVSMPEVTEAVLKNQLAQSNPLLPESNYHTRLNALADFYADRGLFKQAITLLRSEYVKDPTHSKFGYWPKIALLASYANDTEVELEALRRYYQEMTGQLSSTNNEYVDRYLRLLTGQGESGRRELETLLSQNHPQKIQLINYLIRTSDKEFAYRAISSTNLSDLWKLTRRAQVAQALNDYSPETEQLFHKALGSQKIGDIIKNRPNPEEELTGDNWFSFAYTFGHWFETRPNLKDEKLARQYLLARVENRPKDIGAQRDLGNFYLTEKKYQRAINHLQLALTLASFNYQALEAGNSGVQASSEAQDLMLEVGEAYWRMGVEQKARRYWQAATDGDVSISTLQKYFTLLDYLGQANEARERITALIIERLKESKQNEDGTSSFSEYQNLIRLMANSAKDSAERFSYLDRLSMQTGSKDLLMMVASENLVEEAEKVVFIRRLIGLIKVKEIANDAEYLNYLAAAGYSKTKLNQVDDMLEDQYLIVEKGVVGDPYDREAATSQADWIKWRQKLIELLLKYGKTEEFREAFNEVALIDNAFRGHATRPEWLRLAKARALLKLGEKARAIELLEGFVGLRTRPDQTFLPNTNRAVTASRILSNEQNIEESFRLLSRTYSKLLSAGNFDLTSFIGYADAEFKVGNVDTALKTLSLVLELAEPNIKRERKEEIAASFGTTTFVDNGFSVYLESALMAVSEAAARYGRVDLALKYEQRLFEREQLPEHRVVLARLIALAGKSERAVDLLVDTLAIRKINSSERIRALAMLAKIGERENSLLVRAAENSKVLSKEDQQVIRFLQLLLSGDATSLQTAQREIKQLETALIDPVLTLLTGEIAMRSKDYSLAENCFARLIFSEPASLNPFGIVFENSRRQLVSLNVEVGRYKAALFLSSRDRLFNSQNQQTNSYQGEQLSIETMLIEEAAKSDRKLLSLLSTAAERTGNLTQAVVYEQMLLARSEEVGQVAIRTRIDSLNKQIESKNQKLPRFNVDLSLVSRN